MVHGLFHGLVHGLVHDLVRGLFHGLVYLVHGFLYNVLLEHCGLFWWLLGSVQADAW